MASLPVLGLTTLGLPILLPVGGMSVNGGLIIAIGGVVGLLSGLLGVGGGFLLTPILMLAGVPPMVAAASDTNAIVATSSSGVAAHFRLRNVDFRIGTLALAGGLLGSAVGVQALKLLQALGDANLVIRLGYIVMLGAIGGMTLKDSLRKWRSGTLPSLAAPVRRRGLLKRLPWQMDFPRSGVRHSALVPAALCGIVGLMTAIMGVGGGFMLVPAMVYLLGMPAHVAVGTSLFQILFTCMGATLMQATTNHTVDVVLALLIALGSTVGAQLGARLSRRFRGDQLMGLLGILALAVMVTMAVELTLRPPNLLKKPAASASLAPQGPGTRGAGLQWSTAFVFATGARIAL
jgi:hypothetical protein